MAQWLCSQQQQWPLGTYRNNRIKTGKTEEKQHLWQPFPRHFIVWYWVNNSEWKLQNTWRLCDHCTTTVFFVVLLAIAVVALGLLFCWLPSATVCVRVCISASTALSASSATSHEIFLPTYIYSCGQHDGTGVYYHKSLIAVGTHLDHFCLIQ